MKKLLKYVFVSLAVLVVSVAMACVVLVLAVDPNKYKDRITALAEKSLHRPVTISGKVSWTFVPWLGVELGAAEIGNPQGFAAKPMAKIDSIVARVSLASLLHGKVEVGTLAVQGLDVHLMRKADGVDNWSDIVHSDSGAAKDDKKAASKIKAFSLKTIDIQGASFDFDDLLKHQHINVSDAKVKISGLEAGETAELSLSGSVEQPPSNAKALIEFSGQVTPTANWLGYVLSNHHFNLELQQPSAAVTVVKFSAFYNGTVDLNAQKLAFPHLVWTIETQGSERMVYRVSGGGTTDVAAELDKQLWSFASFNGDLRASGGTLPGFGVPFTIHTDAAFNVNDSVGNCYGSKIQLGEALFTGDCRIDLKAAPVISAKLALVPFNLRQAILDYGFVVPNTRDDHTFSSIGGQVTLHWSPKGLVARDINFQVDKSKLAGELQINLGDAPEAHFDIALNGIDADLYRAPLPKGANKPAADASKTTASTSGVSPMARWVANGLVRVGAFKANGLIMRDLAMTVSSDHAGHFLFVPKVSLYDGKMAGRLDVDVSNAEPETDLEANFSGIDVGALLTDYRGSTPITGHGDVQIKASGHGASWEAMAPTLMGDGSAILRDGAIKGINIAQEIRSARAKLRGETLTDADKKLATDFAELSTHFTIDKGIISHDSIAAKSPLMRLDGTGEANLITQKLDYALTVALVDTLKGQGGRDLTELNNVAIPVTVRGTFSDPKAKVDLKRIASDAMKTEAGAEVKKKAKAKVDDLKEKIGNKLKGFLQQ